MYYSQDHYDIRLEWGSKGIEALAQSVQAIVIVDVLSFTTCVDICLQRAATVFPFPWKGAQAEQFAKQKNATLASSRFRFNEGYSLAPSSLISIPENFRLVLPSPNGSTLTLEAAIHTTTYAGCLRNAKALGHHLSYRHTRIAVIPSGERWPDGHLRPAIEDLIGAGAIISHLSGSKSPEAKIAEATYHSCDSVAQSINACASGRELHERGFGEDIQLAADENCSTTVPLFLDGAYIDQAPAT
jgi:2-phosphosulfolactate phosphatase